MARQYVGIDLHRRRSVIVRKNEAGEVLSTRRIDNDPVNLAVEKSGYGFLAISGGAGCPSCATPSCLNRQTS